MAALGSETRVRRARNSAGQKLGDDFLVLDLNSGDYYGLGEVGGWFWKRLDGTETVGELAAEAARRYGLKLERARADLLAFVIELLERDLAEVVEHEAP